MASVTQGGDSQSRVTRKNLPQRFMPGKSGNPGGRPVVPMSVKEAARARTEEAIGVLGEIMADKTAGASARVSAANSLLDRAWGRAEASSTVTVNSDVRSMSTAELTALLMAER